MLQHFIKSSIALSEITTKSVHMFVFIADLQLCFQVIE